MRNVDRRHQKQARRVCSNAHLHLASANADACGSGIVAAAPFDPQTAAAQLHAGRECRPAQRARGGGGRVPGALSFVSLEEYYYYHCRDVRERRHHVWRHARGCVQHSVAAGVPDWCWSQDTTPGAGVCVAVQLVSRAVHDTVQSSRRNPHEHVGGCESVQQSERPVVQHRRQVPGYRHCTLRSQKGGFPASERSPRASARDVLCAHCRASGCRGASCSLWGILLQSAAVVFRRRYAPARFLRRHVCAVSRVCGRRARQCTVPRLCIIPAAV